MDEASEAILALKPITQIRTTNARRKPVNPLFAEPEILNSEAWSDPFHRKIRLA